MTDPQRPLAPRDGRKGRTVRPPPERPPSAPTARPAAEHSPPQQGVRPERVARGVASPEPQCLHAWEVTARQKWLWRVSVRCMVCDYQLPLQGRWWRERDVRWVVNETLARMAAEQQARAAWYAEHGS